MLYFYKCAFHSLSTLQCTVLAQYSARISKYISPASLHLFANYMVLIDLHGNHFFEYLEIDTQAYSPHIQFLSLLSLSQNLLREYLNIFFDSLHLLPIILGFQ